MLAAPVHSVRVKGPLVEVRLKPQGIQRNPPISRRQSALFVARRFTAGAPVESR